MKRTHKGMKTTSGRTSSGVHSSSFPTPSGSNSRSRNSISQSTNYGSRARHYSSSFGQDPGDEDAPRLKIIWLEHENWATAWVRNHFHSGTREPELHCTAVPPSERSSPSAPPPSPLSEFAKEFNRPHRLSFPKRQPNPIFSSEPVEDSFCTSVAVADEPDPVPCTTVANVGRMPTRGSSSTSIASKMEIENVNKTFRTSDVVNMISDLRPYTIMENDTHLLFLCPPDNNTNIDDDIEKELGVSQSSETVHKFTNIHISSQPPKKKAKKEQGFFGGLINWIFNG